MINKIFYKSLTNLDINKLNKDKNFRGCFMRDELKNIKPNKIESGVLNLDTSENQGTHWTCWIKNNNLILYFDSFGLVPPLEIINFFKNQMIIKEFIITIQLFNLIILLYVVIFVYT